MRAFRSRTLLPGLGIAAVAVAAVVTALAVSGGIVAFERWPTDPPDSASRRLVLQAPVLDPASAPVVRPAAPARSALATDAPGAEVPTPGAGGAARPALDPLGPAPPASAPERDGDPVATRPTEPTPTPTTSPASPSAPAPAPGGTLAPVGSLAGGTTTALTQTLRATGDGVRRLLDWP